MKIEKEERRNAINKLPYLSLDDILRLAKVVGNGGEAAIWKSLNIKTFEEFTANINKLITTKIKELLGFIKEHPKSNSQENIVGYLKDPKGNGINAAKDVPRIVCGSGHLDEYSDPNDEICDHNNISSTSDEQGFGTLISFLSGKEISSLENNSQEESLNVKYDPFAECFKKWEDLRRSLLSNTSKKNNLVEFEYVSIGIESREDGRCRHIAGGKYVKQTFQIKVNVVTVEMFGDALRHSQIHSVQMTYTAIFPRDIRMVLYLPVYRESYINRKDEICHRDKYM